MHFFKKEKKSKSKLDLQICKVNQAIVLFLFGFPPQDTKNFTYRNFQKKKEIQPNSRGINYKKSFIIQNKSKFKFYCSHLDNNLIIFKMSTDQAP